MPEENPDVRHIEHGQIMEQLSQLWERDEEKTKNFADWMVRQSEKFDAFKDEFIREIRQLDRGITQKTEMDSAILRRQDEMERRMEAYEDRQTRTAELLTRTATLLEKLETETDKDIESAHDAIRKHKEYHRDDLDPRVLTLEKMAGNTAIAFLKWVGVGVGSIIIAWAVHTLTGFPPL
jgi:chromosome segregation ATPase